MKEPHRGPEIRDPGPSGKRITCLVIQSIPSPISRLESVESCAGRRPPAGGETGFPVKYAAYRSTPSGDRVRVPGTGRRTGPPDSALAVRDHLPATPTGGPMPHLLPDLAPSPPSPAIPPLRPSLPLPLPPGCDNRNRRIVNPKSAEER